MTRVPYMMHLEGKPSILADSLEEIPYFLRHAEAIFGLLVEESDKANAFHHNGWGAAFDMIRRGYQSALEQEGQAVTYLASELRKLHRAEQEAEGPSQ